MLNGPRRVCEVYASLGCAAKCGGCAGTICALLSEAKGQNLGAEAKAGREAKRRIDARSCEGHRHSQSGLTEVKRENWSFGNGVAQYAS